ncbi:MAG: patatin-like phospholipase family protein [Acidimicrobiales bacterium]
MTDRTPRVGLVLGAGGVAGGAYHAGVLAALHDATGWDPRDATVIVGTSAGSISGAALRAGISPADALARAEDRPPSPEGARLMSGVGTSAGLPPLVATRRTIDPSTALATLARAATKPFAARPLAVLAGLVPDGSISTDIITEGISTLFSDRWPDAPLWICSVRQADGRRVVFGRDDRRPPLADVVAASCAIPGFFQPVMIDDKTYIDGGVHSPTNADVALKLDPRLDLVIVSSPMSVTGRGVRIAVDQAARRWAGLLLDGEARRLRRAGVSVVGFQPTSTDAKVMGINAMDLTRRAAIARQAYESTLRRLERSDTRQRLALLSP